MKFVKTNLNPTGKKYGDCVVRALMKANGKSWAETYSDLCAIGLEMYAMPNDKAVYEKYLEQNGWKKQKMPRFEDNSRYTVSEFSEENPKGTFVITVANHITTVVDGILYDTWDCGHKSICNYWV